MDPLSAFGLACNVTQMISFSLEAIKTFKEISNTGSTAANEAMAKSSGQIEGAGKGIQDWLRQYQVTSKPLTTTETALQDVAAQCVQTAAILRDKLRPLETSKRGRKRAIFKTGIRTLFKGNELEKLESQLHGYEQTLQTRILIHLK